MRFFGDLSPASDPLHYVACAGSLLPHADAPLVIVNTPGWVRVRHWLGMHVDITLWHLGILVSWLLKLQGLCVPCMGVCQCDPLYLSHVWWFRGWGWTCWWSCCGRYQ